MTDVTRLCPCSATGALELVSAPATQSNSGAWSAGATATVIAAAVAATVALVGVWVNGRRQERARRRELYASALAAVHDYQEFPYAIRRRRADAPGEERVRLSEALRAVQRDLRHHTALLKLDPATEVAACYEALVAETRRVAGEYMRDAWNGPPLDNDPGVNIADIDYATLAPLETAYLEAIKTELVWWRVWR